jgi:hypothetical protein
LPASNTYYTKYENVKEKRLMLNIYQRNDKGKYQRKGRKKGCGGEGGGEGREEGTVRGDHVGRKSRKRARR